MASLRPISELGSLIQDHTRTIEDGMKGSPGGEFLTSFGSKPAQMPSSLAPPRAELLETLDELRARLLGPMGYLTSLALPSPVITIVLQTLYTYNIASHVPLTPGATITYPDLAARCGLPVDDTRRIMQAAIAFRIFEEASPDTSVRHNALSGILAVIPGMNDVLGFLVEEHTAAAAKFVESLRRWPGSGEPGHCALMLASRAEKGLSNDDFEDPSKGYFDFIADDEKRVARFRMAMGLASNSPAYSWSYFVDSLPWADSEQCPETIADIGGAGGELCHAILRKYPGVKKATVLDLPEVIAGVKAPEDLEARLDFAAYNFLAETVTLKVDAYVFRHIFHDWSDQYAAKILTNLVPALKSSSRIWIAEVVLPDLSESAHTRDQTQRGADLIMKIGHNGKERSKRGWEDLFAEADKRFRIESIVQPAGAHDAIIEVVFDA
ncbi:Uu.00g020120.m01.CDS01 [Anthostomella pinea]|uniref:Uu.00g020120.m01.CDS01 n=1 Tax=Anthostomella pinea TaxID=933095 RepID=A0AAI8YQR2_9PEZI|nr:Uu.00g020120.m01.CDS01 [Anthostomella pinea]